MKSKNYGSSISIDSKINSFIEFKEFQNLNDYYIKVGYNNSELIIILYNIELLNNQRYEIKRGLESILNFQKIFKSNNHISEIYKQVISFLNEGKYKIKHNPNDSITLTLNKNIDFTLICHKDNNEYLQILSNQIRNLKNKNNTCNKTITKLQEENDSIKKEISELKNLISNIQYNLNQNIRSSNKMKSNKSYTNLPKNRSFNNLQVVEKKEQDHAEDNISINEFNKRCGTNINESIQELNLINFKLGNDIIDYLSKIKLSHYILVIIIFQILEI